MTRFVLVSDTHNNRIQNLQDGEVLIHNGDFSGRGKIHELGAFCADLKIYKEKYKHIIVICGNHDFCGEQQPLVTAQMISDTGAIYLNESSVEIEGFKIFGSPITPWFHNWAFNRFPNEIEKNWNKIPLDTQILVTHGPPHGILDKLDHLGSNPGANVGCPFLAAKIKELKDLKLHSFGHIHEGYGTIEQDGVTYVNASLLDTRYRQVNQPIVVTL